MGESNLPQPPLDRSLDPSKRSGERDCKCGWQRAYRAGTRNLNSHQVECRSSIEFPCNAGQLKAPATFQKDDRLFGLNGIYLNPFGPAFMPAGKNTPMAGLTAAEPFTAPPPVTMFNTGVKPGTAAASPGVTVPAVW